MSPGLADEISRELEALERNGLRPAAGNHSRRSFPGQCVLHRRKHLSGLIDFYFACNDSLAYDLAICLNAWCFEPDGAFNATKGRAMLHGYREPASDLTMDERAALPVLARGAAMRFLLTRLYDWLNVPPGALVKPKNPLEYLDKLRFHQTISTSAGEYGLDAMTTRVAIWTDGACSGNPGPGGWGAILTFNGVEKEFCGGEPPTTNNRMELLGRHFGAGGAFAALRHRSAHRFAICAAGRHRLDAQLEAQRLAHRRQQAGQERRSVEKARRGRRTAMISNGSGSRAMPATP